MGSLPSCARWQLGPAACTLTCERDPVAFEAIRDLQLLLLPLWQGHFASCLREAPLPAIPGCGKEAAASGERPEEAPDTGGSLLGSGPRRVERRAPSQALLELLITESQTRNMGIALNHSIFWWFVNQNTYPRQLCERNLCISLEMGLDPFDCVFQHQDDNSMSLACSSAPTMFILLVFFSEDRSAGVLGGGSSN